MFTRMALLLFPTWRALSKEERALVWRDCVHPQVTSWQHATVSSTLFSALLLAILFFAPWPASGITFVVTVLLGADPLDILWIAIRWHTVRDFIQRRRSTVSAAA